MREHLQAIVTVLSPVNPLISGAMFAQIVTGQDRATQLNDATRVALSILLILGVTALVGARVLQIFRRVNAAEAAVVRRIFEAYAAGMPPRKIARMLNSEGIPGPRRRGWGASTIHGNAARGTGILNNSLYVGKFAGVM